MGSMWPAIVWYIHREYIASTGMHAMISTQELYQRRVSLASYLGQVRSSVSVSVSVSIGVNGRGSRGGVDEMR